jgi:hypothetical protein
MTIMKNVRRLLYIGVYTRVSVYQEWIHRIIDQRASFDGSSYANLSNTIIMGHQSNQWLDRDGDNRAIDLSKSRTILFNLLVVLHVYVHCEYDGYV